jgi:hypothetical protein
MAIVTIHVAEPTNAVMIDTAVELDDQSEFFIVDIGLVGET